MGGSMKKNKRTVTIRFKGLLDRPGSLRQIGEVIRKEIIRQWKTYDIVELDFENETVASGSLFDEIVKLFNDYPKDEVKRRLRFVNIDPWDERLIVHLAKLRLERKTIANQNEYTG
jgi:hypothetical protein